MNLISSGEAKFIDQDESKSTYAKKIKKEESKIDWNMSADKLIAKINGLNPSPGAWFEHKSNRIKIVEAVKVNLNGKIGEVLDQSLVVGCKQQSIRILQIQREGKKL